MKEPLVPFDQAYIENLIYSLRYVVKDLRKPAALLISKEYNKNPFLILISCLLSLRAKDTASYPVSKELFLLAKTPQQLLKIPRSDLENIIYSVGFYRQKADTLISVSQELIIRFKGEVPKSEIDLLSIKGIGRKTANLVLGEAFGIPAICVDVHVHKISNMLGLVNTKNPTETEFALQEIIPKQYWIEWNYLLVAWGQNRCRPSLPNIGSN